MFVVDSRNWKPEQASGQERLLVEFWMECAGMDTTCLYWPPLCSTLQTVRNVLTTLNEVQGKILKEYHIPHLAEESLVRLGDCTWLEARYEADVVVLRELLLKLRGKESGPPEVGASDKSPQAVLRATVASFLKAFIAKVERDNPIAQLTAHVCTLTTAKPRTGFEVLERAVAELVNELIHAGHSRDHLHGWMGAMVRKKKAAAEPYLTRFEAARELGVPLAGGCEVLFLVDAPQDVPNSDRIQFHDTLPAQFTLPAGSLFVKQKTKRYAIVKVPCALDRQAARDEAYYLLHRYLHSTRLAGKEFAKQFKSKAAVLVVGTKEVGEVQGFPDSEPHRLHNDLPFYEMARDGRDEGTFAELDRVLYWLEQSRRWDDVGRLIALWTALEFLFSKSEKAAAESIQEILPAYLVPKYPRELLLDLWVFLESAGEVALPQEIDVRVEVQVTKDDKGRERRKASLVKLLDLCLQDDATNPLKAIIKDYPILLRKYYRIRRLNPTLKGKTSSEAEIWTDLSRFEQELIFDLRYAYRARNTIVHDAAIQIVQIEPLIQRLNWMLCTALDTLLFQFVRNPNLSLTDLHAVNKHNFTDWKKRLRDEKTPVPLPEVVNMPQPCLVVN